MPDNELETFCVALKRLRLTQPQQALAMLWFVDRARLGSSRSSGELARLLRDSGLGNPHSTRLGEAVIKSSHALRSGDQLRIKPTSKAIIQKWIAPVLMPEPPTPNQSTGYLPQAIWDGTRGYIEKIAAQINGCYEFGFYDGASVLARKLVEVLLIDCYEHLKIEQQIKRQDGEYKMLSEIIVRAVDGGQLQLGRESKAALKDIKRVGDRAAHARRYVAVQADLDGIKPAMRVVVDELLHLAGMK